VSAVEPPLLTKGGRQVCRYAGEARREAVGEKIILGLDTSSARIGTSRTREEGRSPSFVGTVGMLNGLML
jgi:hypothetical protein